MKNTYSVKLTLIALILVALIGGVQQINAVALAQSGDLLTYGTSVIGFVDASNPVASYTFNGTAGDLVHVEAKGLTGGFDPAVNLTGPDQQTLARNEHNRLAANSQQAQISLFLPQTGAYTIMVTGVNGTTGSFLLRLNGRGPVAATPLIPDQPVQVTVAENAQPQFFSFDALECPTMLRVDNLADGDPFTFPYVVKVRNDDGHIVAILRGGAAQGDQVTVVPLSGRYEVEVTSVDPLVTGMISLWVGCTETMADCGSESATAAGTGTDTELACRPCPECNRDFTPDDGPACPEMGFRIVESMEGPSFAWNPVEGAEFYHIYITELRGDLPPRTRVFRVPGDETTVPMGDGMALSPETTGLRFVIEAIRDGVVICQDEIIDEFTFAEPLCGDLNLMGDLMMVEGEQAVEWTWAPYSGAERYAVGWTMLAEDGSPLIAGAGSTHETTFTTYFPESGEYVAQVRFSVQVIVDGVIVCADTYVLDLARQQVHPFCPELNLTVSLLDPATMRTELTWNPVPLVARYEIRWYGIHADGAEDYFGAIGVGSGDSSYTFDNLPQLGHAGFRFVLLAFSLDGSVICEAEITLMLRTPLDQTPVCDEDTFRGGVTEYPDSLSARVGWHAYPDAQGYYFNILDASGAPLPGYPMILPADQLEIYVDLGPGTFTLQYGPWDEVAGILCLSEETVSFGDSLTALPCEISTTRRDVRVHVGPGRHRNVFDFLTAGQSYTVTGQAADDEGNLWWQLDKTQIPGHEAAISLWVAQLDVVASELCGQMPMVEAPPIVPDGQPMWPEGQWGPCGSCDTCGHSANECVTSPEGECLWDPGHCLDHSGNQPGGTATCFGLGTAISGAQFGSISILTALNCSMTMNPSDQALMSSVAEPKPALCSAETSLSLRGGSQGYTPGTVVTVQYNPPSYPICSLSQWSGCGASGGGNTTSFTMTGSCTVTAHVTCP